MKRNAEEAKTALVLGGGGALGSYQLGAVARIVEERGDIAFDLIIGNSIGSLNAAMIAAGETDRLRELWSSIRNRNFSRFSPWGLIGGIAGRGGFCSNRPLKKFLERFVTEEIFRKIVGSKTKLIITATCAETGEKILFSRFSSREELIGALLGSMCIPGYFAPQKVVNCGCEYLVVDGGVINDLPADEAVLDGCGEIFVIPLFPGRFSGTLEKGGWTETTLWVLDRLLHESRENSVARGNAVSEAINGFCRTREADEKMLRNIMGDKEFERLGISEKLCLNEAECWPYAGLKSPEIILIQPERPLGRPKAFLRGMVDFDPDRIRANAIRGYSDADRALAERLR